MLVIAIKLGFRNGSRVRIGQELNLPDAELKRGEGGKPVLPKWVVEATPENRQRVKDGRKFEAQRAKEAAIAASGPKRKQKGFASAAPDASELV